jgi:hypothetical protein
MRKINDNEFTLYESIVIFGILDSKKSIIKWNEYSIHFWGDVLIFHNKKHKYEIKGAMGKYVFELLRFFEII